MLDKPKTPPGSSGREEPLHGEAELWDATAQGIAPREELSPYEFGRQHRVYGKEGKSARWRPDETPWAKGILHTLSDESPIRRVFCPKGTQLGFTELGLIWVGEGVYHGASTLAIFPTEAVAKRMVKTKFRPMLKSTTILDGIFSGRAADTTLHFEADSVDVIFAGSNSPVNFASVTVPRVMGDEIDRWDPDLKDEGDPLDLLENRIAEYGFLGKMFMPSSPTIEGASLVWAGWLESDQRVFKCPCPDPACAAKQQWLWENMERDAANELSGKLLCVECGQAFSEIEWKSAWHDGEWVATVETPVRPDTAGFHLSTMYSRLGQRTWSQLVVSFNAIIKSGLASRMQTFWNTILGLPWKVGEDAVPIEALRARLEPLERGVVPMRGLSLFCGVDYQKNRLEAFVWAQGRQRERWLVDHVEISRLKKDGSPRASKDVATELNDLVLSKAWPHEAGGALNVEYTCHDSSNLPVDVYDVIEHLPVSKNLAIKGREGWGQKLAFTPWKILDVKHDGKVVLHGRRLAIINTAVAKSEWYDDLRRTPAEDGPSERYVHLPEWLDQEEGRLQQLINEERRTSKRGKPFWHKLGPNEGLDCAIYAACAAWQAKAHRWDEGEWKKREKLVATARQPDGPPPAAPRRSRMGGRF